MKPHPTVARRVELIREHSTRIQNAQKELREAIRAAEKDGITEEMLYT